MAGDWIKMRTNLDTDPAVVRLASGLKTDRYSVVGRLHKIWSWANEHLTDGQDVPVDAEFLDCLVEAPGFSVELRRVGWLSGRDGSLSFPCFDRHNGSSAKQRALDAERKKTSRGGGKRSAKCPDDNRTEVGPEKRREEKSINKQKHPREMSPHWRESEEFQSVWLSWLSHAASTRGPVSDDSEQQQLYDLARFSVEEAITVVRFSLSKGARNLITNGDHKQQATSSSGQRGRNKSVSFEEGLI